MHKAPSFCPTSCRGHAPWQVSVPFLPLHTDHQDGKRALYEAALTFLLLEEFALVLLRGSRRCWEFTGAAGPG